MKRNKNKKIVLASTIVLGIAAITSSALAAYIITGGATEGSADVKPSRVEIDNKVVDLKVGVVSKELLFQPTTPVEEGAITTSGNGNLTINIPLTVKAKDQGSIPDYNVTVREEGKGVTTGEYIVLPGTIKVTKDNFTFVNAETGFTYNLPLTWSWGSAFGGSDPAEFYNPKIKDTEDDVDVNDALTALNAFAEAVNGTTFVVTITQVDAQPGA